MTAGGETEACALKVAQLPGLALSLGMPVRSRALARWGDTVRGLKMTRCRVDVILLKSNINPISANFMNRQSITYLVAGTFVLTGLAG
jgi:hypothetical protein